MHTTYTCPHRCIFRSVSRHMRTFLVFTQFASSLRERCRLATTVTTLFVACFCLYQPSATVCCPCNMPRTRKSKTNLLPKAYRTNQTSKIRVLSPPPSPPLSSNRSISIPSVSKPPFPLDDDSLLHVLRQLPLSSLLVTSRVSRTFRRLSLLLLYRTHTLTFTQLYPKSSPPPALIFAQLSNFPTLRSLTLSHYPNLHVYPDFTHQFCTNYTSVTLESLSILNLPLQVNSLVSLIPSLPSLSQLRLGRHSSVSDKALLALAKLYLSTKDLPTLQTLSIINAPVSNESMRPILTHVQPHSLVLNSCQRLTTLFYRPSPGAAVDSITLQSCGHIITFKTYSDTAHPQRIQLSHCQKLRNVSLAAPVKKLLINACRNVADISVPDCADTATHLAFDGVYAMTPIKWDNLFRWSVNWKPRHLISLRLTGTRVESIVMDGWESLQVADLSGCSQLLSVVIRDCPELAQVRLSGRKAPLDKVDVLVKETCAVEGIRKQWHWEKKEGRYLVYYP